MTIRHKILLACLSLTVIAALLGAYSHSAQRTLGLVATSIYDDTVLGVSYLRSAEITLARAGAAWHSRDGETGSGATAAVVAVLPDVLGDLDVARERAMSPAGRQAAELVREGIRTLADTVQGDLVDVTGSENRGVKQNYFVVIRDARVPAVLVELGFVDSPLEGPKLASEDYRRTLATALADGVEAFLAQGGTLATSGQDGTDAP